MKTLLITLFTLSIFTTTAQELKKVNKSGSNGPFDSYKEEYEVLKDEKKVKQGSYKKWRNNVLVEEGHYKGNKRDSTWLTYGLRGNVLIVMGCSNKNTIIAHRRLLHSSLILHLLYIRLLVVLILLMKNSAARLWSLEVAVAILR